MKIKKMQKFDKNTLKVLETTKEPFNFSKSSIKSLFIF